MARPGISNTLFAAGCLLFAGCSVASPPPAEPGSPKIQLMTSLPLVWGDDASMNSILSGEAAPAAIYAYWQERYAMEPVDSLENLDGSDTDIVFLIQPRAMAPADLADLDRWVRAGGAAIILTDPALAWPSHLPLGDNRRPLASGLLSPLLKHWGLELVLEDQAAAEIVELDFKEHRISTIGVGSFEALPGADQGRARCQYSGQNILALCRVGQGQAVLIADADFLHEDLWADDPLWKQEKRSAAMRIVDQIVDEIQESRR